MTGAIKRKEVPVYVNTFDVCIIPYQANRYNEASFPLKFWEFMATGKPIVATGVPELKEYSDVVGYAESSEEFIKLSEVWLSDSKKGSEERMSLAEEHSWNKRTERLLELLESVIK
jgi:glycosyltransferase involved in cell wall biosynthesis